LERITRLLSPEYAVGKGGGKRAGLAKFPILIESDSYEEVEDVIVIITHMLKMALLERLQPSPATP